MPLVKNWDDAIDGKKRILILPDILEYRRIAAVKKMFREKSAEMGFEIRDSLRTTEGLQAFDNTGSLVGEFDPNRQDAWVRIEL